ncbi:MAG: spondin domain-containing protein, partial [Planctomycetota bacterium]
MRRYTLLCFQALAFAAAVAAVAPAAQATERLRVEVQNLGPAGGFFLTPTWIGLHNGSFDLFDFGAAATPGLEALAEDGIIGTLSGEFAGPARVEGVVTGPSGFGSMTGQPPLIDTGETAVGEIAIGNAAAYRYLSFASMVIPSNDAFIGNEDPFAYEVFDASGAFNGELVIELTGADIWDSGTEMNDTLDAAFSTVGGSSSDENGTVEAHPGLTNFEGTGTPVGPIGLGLAPGATDPVARITVSLVPEPGAAVLMSIGAIAAVG